MPATPYPYQEEGIQEIEDFGGRVLLADEMGLGKTLQALWYMERHPETLPGIIICPASVKYNWEHEAVAQLNWHAAVLEGRKPPRRRRFCQHPSLTILNYDILPQWTEWLAELKPQCIVLDECQYIQNRRAKRTRAVQELCKEVPYVLALSGTPLMNRPAELWTTLNILDPERFASFWSFGQEYCRPRRTPWGWEFKGATNLDKLHKRLRRGVMIRRLKKDVLKDLPEKVRHVVPMDLKNRAEYEKASTNFRTWLIENFPKQSRRSLRALAVTRIGYLLRLTGRLKCRSVVRWANQFLRETDEKLILYAVHKKMIKALARRVKAKHVIVDGSVTGRKRKAAVDQFQQDPHTRLFIGNIRAAGIGLTLTAASTVGFAEMYWRPADHTQAEDRAHRIGQKKVTWVNYLVSGGTIEEDLCRIVQEKQQVINSTLDGQPVNDLDVFDLLLKALLK